MHCLCCSCSDLCSCNATTMLVVIGSGPIAARRLARSQRDQRRPTSLRRDAFLLRSSLRRLCSGFEVMMSASAWHMSSASSAAESMTLPLLSSCKVSRFRAQCGLLRKH